MSDTLSTPRSGRRKKKRNLAMMTNRLTGHGDGSSLTNEDTPTSTTDSPRSFDREVDQRSKDRGDYQNSSRSNRTLDNRVLRDPFAASNRRRGNNDDDDDDDDDDKDDSDEGIEVGQYRRQQANSRGKAYPEQSSTTPRSSRPRLEALNTATPTSRGKRRESYNRDAAAEEEGGLTGDTPRSRARNLRRQQQDMEEQQEEEEKQERIRRLRDRSGGSSRERDHSPPQSGRQKSAREREAERFRERELESNRLRESERLREREKESDRLRQNKWDSDKLNERSRESERLRERRRSRDLPRDEDGDEEMPSIRARGKSSIATPTRSLATPPRTPQFSDNSNQSPHSSNSTPSSLLRPLAGTSRNSRLVSPRVSTTSLDADSDQNITAGLPLNRRFRLATINDSGPSENSEDDDDDDDAIVVSKPNAGYQSSKTHSHAEKRLHDSDGDSQRFNNKRSTRDSEVFSKKPSSLAIPQPHKRYSGNKDFTSEEDEDIVNNRTNKLHSSSNLSNSKITRNRNFDIQSPEDKDKNKFFNKKPNTGSTSVNRTYEKDDFIAELRASKNNSSCLDMSLNSGFKSGLTLDTMSSASTQSTSVLRQLSSREARSRSYLVGSLTSGSGMLSGSELERFFPERKARVFVGTWNMCEHKFSSFSSTVNKEPSAKSKATAAAGGGGGEGVKTAPKDTRLAEDVEDFLLPETCELVHDIYAIGTQESCPNRAEWDLKLQETLGPQHVLLHSASFGVLHLSIFIRRDLIWYCSVCESDSVSTRGGPSSVKTKGAIAICFSLFGTSMMFVNSHLAAHEGKLQQRIAGFNKICNSLKLPKLSINNEYIKAYTDATAKFDATFWCGDLNFRILGQRDHIHDHVNVDEGVANIALLLKQDELSMAMNDAIAFESFQEGRIKFKPTYKFNIGTNDYENKKLRTPSYTDRVLFRSKRKHGVTCLFYDSVPSITLSDHKPVFALFEINLRPGRDNTELSGGLFKRDVWLEANRRRSEKQDRIETKKSSSSSVCCLQ